MEEGAREQYLWETDRGKGRRQAGTRIRVRIDTVERSLYGDCHHNTSILSE